LSLAEVPLFWLTTGLYAIGFLIYLAALIFKKREWLGYGTLSLVLGLLPHTGALAARWAAGGHPPLMGNYENAITGAWFVKAFFLGTQYRFPNLRGLGIAIAPFSAAMLLYGSLSFSGPEPITPALRGGWLFLHVLFAWFTYSSYVVASGLAFLFLIRVRQSNRGPADGFYGRLPEELAILDELSYRFIGFGFVTQAFLLVTGATWASQIWGTYWNWDPVQTWTLLSWVIYAIYLHLRTIHRWRGRRAAWLALFALATVIVSFWGVNAVRAGLHVFNLM